MTAYEFAARELSRRNLTFRVGKAGALTLPAPTDRTEPMFQLIAKPKKVKS